MARSPWLLRSSMRSENINLWMEKLVMTQIVFIAASSGSPDSSMQVPLASLTHHASDSLVRQTMALQLRYYSPPSHACGLVSCQLDSCIRGRSCHQVIMVSNMRELGGGMLHGALHGNACQLRDVVYSR